MAAAKKKTIKIKVDKQSTLTNYSVSKEFVTELNFFDLTGEKAKTKGSSCKFYHLELQISPDNKCQLYSEYGPTGRIQAREWRYFDTDIEAAQKEYQKIIKSKIKKGYQQIDVAKRAVGSTEAKKHEQPKQNNKTLKKKKTKPINLLHDETSRIISTLMGSTKSFVDSTLKCPLGQLSDDQINSGRTCLQQATAIVNGTEKLTKKAQEDKIKELTNQFYTLIPHNLGAGSRGVLNHLLLDSIGKINQKEYDLDTLSDAKAIGNTLAADNDTYQQYLSLDTTFEYIEKNDPLFSWLNSMVVNTKASNHGHLGKVILLNAWKVDRKSERNIFLSKAKSIAKECGKQVIPNLIKNLVTSRTDILDNDLYKKANILPLFHGTRTQNVTGILKKGMLIRPSGVVITGAMYGSGTYWAQNSTKSINYTSIRTSYWAKGSDDRGFLFLGDCVLGNQHIANRAYQYNLKNIAPCHSVWAKSGKSGIINDEFMLYRTDQHHLRYLLEFTCRKGR